MTASPQPAQRRPGMVATLNTPTTPPPMTVAAVDTGAPSTYPTYAAKSFHTPGLSKTSQNQASGTLKHVEPMAQNASFTGPAEPRRPSSAASLRTGGATSSASMPGSSTAW